jgi:FtsZ-binding cell division protein ZapB
LDLADAVCEKDKAFFRGVLRVVETVEALKQTNKELRDKYAKLNDFEQSQCAKLLAENGRLKAQNKLMHEALMCLPGAMGATVTQEVCKMCSRHLECEDCLIDRAIREAMGG